MRALLLGASGWLGSRVGRAALAAGWDVVAAGRGPAVGAAGRGPAVGGSCWCPAPGRHVVLDLAAGAGAVAAVLDEVAPDVVLHCAGATAGDLRTLTGANVEGPANLVTALLAAGSPARLVHLGSAAEYGRGPDGVPVREDAPARPLGPYGATKLAGTRLVQVGRAAGLPAVVLRVFNPVGPGAPTHTLPGRAAAELARVARSDGVVRLGGLDAVRDFVDVDDVAHAVLAAATGPLPSVGVVNVGSGAAVSARELVTMLVAVSGARVRVDEDAGGSARSADVPWQQADVGLAAATWGWHARTPLAASLAGLWAATAERVAA